MFNKDFFWGFDTVFPVTLMSALRWSTNIGEYPALTPLALFPSEAEMLSWVNQFKEFRISKIKLKWIPAFPGKPVLVEDIRTNIPPVIDRSLNWRTLEMFITLPRMMPVTRSLRPEQGSQNQLWIDPDINPWNAVPNSALLQMTKPRPIRKNMHRSWTFSWTPLVSNSYNYTYATPNGIALNGDEEANLQSNSKLKKMPWVRFINPQNASFSTDPVVSGAVFGNMKMILGQPFVALRDTYRNAWQSSANPDVCGKLMVTTTIHFRRRRTNQSCRVNSINTETGELLVVQNSYANTLAST